MKFLKLLFFVALISGCGFKAIDIEVQAVCTIVDMDNKPVANKKVNLYFKNHNSTFDPKSLELRQTKNTDGNGKVQFDYVWQNDESTTNYFFIGSEDNPIFDNSPFKSINYIQSDFSSATKSAKVTINETIRVDSLKPLTVRLKSNRTDLYRYIFRAQTNNADNNINRLFKTLDVTRTASKLDTSFVIHGYSKQEYVIITSTSFNTAPTVLDKTIKIDASINKDSVLLIVF